MTTTPAPPSESLTSPRGADAPGARPWASSAFAVLSAATFAGAAVVVVRANEYAWDLEARYVLSPDEDQSLYGIAFFLYAAILVLPALVHLGSLVVHLLQAVRPGRGDRSASPLLPIAWVAFGVGVLGYTGVTALGVVMCLGLGRAPADLQAAAMAANLAPLALVAAPGVFALFLRSRGAR